MGSNDLPFSENPALNGPNAPVHEEIVATRGGKVEAVWRVAGRGKIK